jgi:putative phosphoesterase
VRLAIISDIHGNLPALEAVVADITARGTDHVINLGDHLSGPLLPKQTAQYLMAQSWTQLAGNHDRQVLTMKPEAMGRSDRYAHDTLGESERDWLRTLKPCQRFDDRVLLCHGTPRDDLEYFLETVEPTGLRLATQQEVAERLGRVDAELILCGHTHTPRVVRALTGQLIVNPGSIGVPAYTDAEPFPHSVESGAPEARYAIAERGKNGWQIELHSVPYDHDAMASLAQQHGRADWAHWLATGYAKSH